MHTNQRGAADSLLLVTSALRFAGALTASRSGVLNEDPVPSLSALCPFHTCSDMRGVGYPPLDTSQTPMYRGPEA